MFKRLLADCILHSDKTRCFINSLHEPACLILFERFFEEPVDVTAFGAYEACGAAVSPIEPEECCYAFVKLCFALPECFIPAEMAFELFIVYIVNQGTISVFRFHGLWFI
jgi:hypothetical protein